MGRVAVIGSETNVTSCRLVSEWRSAGIDAALSSARAACDTLGPGDLAVGRLDVLATLDGVEAGLADLFFLARRGIEVRNTARALVLAHDKLRTARALAVAGLPQPRTGWVSSPDDPLPCAPPLVVKPRFGSWGAGVTLCEDESTARRVLREAAATSWFRRHGALVQEVVGRPGRDLRVLVAGGRPIGAVSRTPAPGEWRTNVSLGGSKSRVAADEAASSLAVAAAAACHGDLVVVDLLPLPDGGLTVLELNGAADFDDDYAAPGRSVYREVADALEISHAPRYDERGRAGAPR